MMVMYKKNTGIVKKSHMEFSFSNIKINAK